MGLMIGLQPLPSTHPPTFSEQPTELGEEGQRAATRTLQPASATCRLQLATVKSPGPKRVQ